MIRRAVTSLVRRQVQLEDDRTSVNLQFTVGRRTVRVALQSTRNDAPRRGGLFTDRRSASSRGGFGPHEFFDEELLDVDEGGFVLLPDGSRIHVEDPRLLMELGRFAP